MSGWQYAFSLSKEEVRSSEPPGTRLMLDDSDQEASSRNDASGHLRLIPQPTDDPADPLNIPRARKAAIWMIICLYALTADYIPASVAPALTIMKYTKFHDKTVGELSYLLSTSVLLYGTSNMFWVPITNIFGRRIVLISSMLGLLLTGVWCGVAESFDSLLAARIVQGFFGGPVFTIPPTLLGDMFFLHEQGRAIAIYQTFLALAPNLAGIVGGYIATNIGYRYLFYIPTALMGLVLILTLLVIPETTFDRPAEVFNAPIDPIGKPDSEKVESATLELVTTADLTLGGPSPRPHIGYLQSLKIGIYRGQVLRSFLLPWKALLLPAVWPLMLQIGGLIGGIVAMSTLAPILLYIPPYMWGAKVGLINIAGIIGSVLGGLLLSAPSDWLLRRMVRRRAGGLVEPEMRLPLLLPGAVIGIASFLVFGFCATSHKLSAWVGMAFGIGMMNASTVGTLSHAYNYLLEAYGPVYGQSCILMTTIVRGAIAFGFSFFIVDWVMQDGAPLPFGILAMIFGIFCLMGIPLWVFGKRMRIATAHIIT